MSYTSSLSTCPRPLPEVEGDEEEEEREGDLTGPLSLPPPPLLLDGIDDDAVSPPVYVYIVLYIYAIHLGFSAVDLQLLT